MKVQKLKKSTRKSAWKDFPDFVKLRLCSCGCGSNRPLNPNFEIYPSSVRKYLNEENKVYIDGHRLKGFYKHKESTRKFFSLTRQGKHHTKETKKKLSENHKGKLAWYDFDIMSKSGKRTHALLKKEGRLGSGYFKTHKYPKSAKLKGSKSIKKLVASGELSPGDNIRNFIRNSTGKELYWSTRVNKGVHGKYFSSKMKKKIHYDSSWELKYLKILDQRSSIVSFARCPFLVRYNFKNKSHRHYPDFFLVHKDGSKSVVEIKPKQMLLLPQIKKKVLAAKKTCDAKGITYKLVYLKQEKFHVANV